MATRYMGHLKREAIKIRLYPNNFNRDEGFTLSHTQHPVINLLKRSRDTPMGKQGQAELGMLAAQSDSNQSVQVYIWHILSSADISDP
jgi:hypothetical protein